MLAVTSITFFFVADVKCGLYEINKNNRPNAPHRPSPVQKMFRDRTEVMLDRRGPGPGPVPVPVVTHRCIQDFLWGCTFLDQNADDLFLVTSSSPSFRWSYASYIATTYLFISSHFRRPERAVQLHPRTLPGCTYE